MRQFPGFEFGNGIAILWTNGQSTPTNSVDTGGEPDGIAAQ